MNGKWVGLAYAFPALYAAFAGLAAWSFGDEPADIFGKMLIAPMMLLATRGLREYFPEVKDEDRDLWTQLEYQFLNSLLVSAATMLIITPSNEKNVVGMLFFVLVMASGMTVTNMAFFLHARRKRRTGP